MWRRPALPLAPPSLGPCALHTTLTAAPAPGHHCVPDLVGKGPNSVSEPHSELGGGPRASHLEGGPPAHGRGRSRHRGESCHLSSPGGWASVLSLTRPHRGSGEQGDPRGQHGARPGPSPRPKPCVWRLRVKRNRKISGFKVHFPSFFPQGCGAVTPSAVTALGIISPRPSESPSRCPAGCGQQAADIPAHGPGGWECKVRVPAEGALRGAPPGGRLQASHCDLAGGRDEGAWGPLLREHRSHLQEPHLHSLALPTASPLTPSPLALGLPQMDFRDMVIP